MRRFFRTPKGVMTAILAILVAGGAATLGAGRIAPTLLAAALPAMLLDLVILRVRNGRWEFPSGALLSGLFVAMVLSPHERWHVAAITSLVAVASKYVLRGRSANIFNPAALAIVLTFYVFGTGHDWWGALPDAGLAGLAVLFATGIFMTARVNKMPLVLAFFGAYFLAFTVMAFAGEPRLVAEVFRSPDINAALFFAFFILTDPPTSPTRYRDQIVCGVVVAVSSFAVFELLGAVHYMLSGVLVGNVWEAARRRQVDARRAADRAATISDGEHRTAALESGSRPSLTGG